MDPLACPRDRHRGGGGGFPRSIKPGRAARLSSVDAPQIQREALVFWTNNFCGERFFESCDLISSCAFLLF